MITRMRQCDHDMVELVVEFDRPEAGQVALYCDVPGWQPIQMRQSFIRRGGRKTGPFRARALLPSGLQPAFCYLVDDSEWVEEQAS